MSHSLPLTTNMPQDEVTFWLPVQGSDYLLDETDYAHSFNPELWYRSDGKMGRVSVGPTKMLGGTADAFVDFPLTGDVDDAANWAAAQQAAIRAWEALKAVRPSHDGIATRRDFATDV